MKTNILLVIGAFMLLFLSSCWDFNRKQMVLDAEAQGKATLMEAENSKKALIEQAKAENESATLQAEARITIAKAEAQAEVERAKGVAEANKIIGESLEGNDIYLRYLQIDAIRHSEGEKIYIPTEAGLPLLEAR